MTSHPGRSPARRASAVVIGAGHAGLAASYELDRLGIDHVVLERGEVANSWRNERWESLRLLTPNWQTRLPGLAYSGDQPDGFMSAAEVTRFIADYARLCAAPLHTHTRVTGVRQDTFGYRVVTDRGTWQCRAVVLASGACNLASTPALSAQLPRHIAQVTALEYRNPAQLQPGGVLVVGASASGVQIARELSAAGRHVVIAVGEHLRMPRVYRGRDIQYWMELTGLLDDSYCEVDDLERVRRLPSPQLVGGRDHNSLDLNALRDMGVEVVGRLAGLWGSTLQFSGALANAIKLADLKQQRLLAGIDQWIASHLAANEVEASYTPEPTRLDNDPRLALDLDSREITTVLWATGFRPDYSWLQVPVLDRRGRLRHDGGVCPAPGLYAMGLAFMRKRRSGFICGAGDDARFIAGHLAHFLRGDQAQPAQLTSIAPMRRPDDTNRENGSSSAAGTR